MNFFSGNINEDLTFEYGDGTAAHYGCGATLNNEFWYFGGSNKRQVKSQKYLLYIFINYISGKQNSWLQARTSDGSDLRFLQRIM